ncbi:uncharacterized protein [Primulina huaijiensis]|uniref:uncharacterized protein n=1 Tax=Primulina huaijiensis TaxID=1492673 RepID=UPI003CC70316
MGKSIPAAHRFEHFAKAITSTRTSLRRPTQSPPTAKIPRPISSSHPAGPGPESRHRLKLNNRGMEAADKSERQRRLPLAEVVTDCVNRWFQDTLKEAKTGDTAMQVLVGQMYYRGYGVARDAQKGRAWIGRAAKSRSSVWKVGDKHPGYNASDSDSDDPKEDAK